MVELLLARKLKHPAYVFDNGLLEMVVLPGTSPSKEQVQGIIQRTFREVFLYDDDIQLIKSGITEALIKTSRSLSVGDPIENGSKQIKLLSMNMGNLYQNPYDDQLLTLQFQSTQNLSKFLVENKRHQANFFQSVNDENLHFTLAQPMLSSILLLSFLQSIHLFNDKEIENLFLASYLKDFGLSLIPKEKHDLKTLSPKDLETFSQHAEFSFELLEGRVPISKNHLTLIKHHHFMNDKLKEIVTGQKTPTDPEIITGLESTLVSVFDMLVAMTSNRPYRRGLSLFQALDLIKKTMADDYPQEFRALVVFLKKFYKN